MTQEITPHIITTGYTLIKRTKTNKLSLNDYNSNGSYLYVSILNITYKIPFTLWLDMDVL